MKKYVILGHKNPDVDSIVSGYLLEKLLRFNGYDVSFVIPDNKISEETYKILSKFSLNPNKFMRKLDSSDNNFILVDHSERDVKRIVGIIDHHPNIVGNNDVNYYLNTKSSSTACLITKFNCNNNFTKYDYELMVLATMIDTASFHSTKSVISDLDYIKDICSKYDIDYDILYNEGLCLSDISDLDKAKLNGLKEYFCDGIKLESSFLHVDSFDKRKDNILEIIELLKEYCNIKNIEHFIFVVHDMNLFKTRVYDINKNNVYMEEYSKYSSRGDKIIPDMFKKILKK